MGNCLRHQSPTTWGGDEWDFLTSERHFHNVDHVGKMENESLLGEKNGVSSTEIKIKLIDHVGKMENVSLLGEKNGVSSTEIKIKLTKKQMEELLAKVGMQGMSIEQILTQLVNKDGECHLHHQAWRPELQSIPEVN